MERVSNKSRLIDALLCYFLGVIGIHKFYEEKIGMGILYLFTGGLFMIGVIVDLIMILSGSAVDAAGDPIKEWMPDDAERAHANPEGYDHDYTKEPKKTGPSVQEKENENIDILKQYKDMLDNGMITEEEYNKKKKEILG